LDKEKTYGFTDQYLVGRILQGEVRAFEIIINDTKGLVAQIAWKMINSAEDRKDIIQEIYAKAFKELSGFRFQSKLSTWIGKIAYNTCLGYLEKKKLFSTIDISDESQEKVLEDLTISINRETVNTAETMLINKDLAEILKFEIENLPLIYKTLIALYHNEDISYAEIAQITNLPEGTVKNYLYRARKVLKERLLSKYKREDL
jgi:RNA polymerase sigma-70 factor (ECF subfamily)